MAVVTSDILLLTQAGVKTEFDMAYNKPDERPVWQQVATEVPTTLPVQNYAWLGRGAVMQEFKDEAEAQSVTEKNFYVSDVIYKANLQVSRKSLEDDQYGLLMQRIRGLAGEALRHWNQLVFAALAKSFTTLCYDGQYMCDTDHSEGSSGTQSNTSSDPLSDAALEAAYSAMSTVKDDKGLPMGIVPDSLIVGPYLARRAEDLAGQGVRVINVGDGTAGSGATAGTPIANFWSKVIKNIIIDPYLDNMTLPDGTVLTARYNWFLADLSREIKPIIIQNRSDVPITVETDMDQPSAKIKEIYNCTVRGRYAAANGLWQTLFGSSAMS